LLSGSNHASLWHIGEIALLLPQERDGPPSLHKGSHHDLVVNVVHQDRLRLDEVHGMPVLVKPTLAIPCTNPPMVPPADQYIFQVVVLELGVLDLYVSVDHRDNPVVRLICE
jgi:hypothetical protein